MVSKKSSLIIAAIVTIFSFITVAYVSCSKKGKDLNTCEYVVCENGGYCYVDTANQAYTPLCVCPTGFEGANCETPSVQKFLGTWNMRQVDTGSDSTIGQVFLYTVVLQPTATPTTFFIDNFSNDPFYNNIICTIDSTPNNSTPVIHFFLDTISAYHMLYNNYQLLYGYGNINSTYDTIQGTFAVRHLSPTTNWIHDTFTITLTLH